MVPPAVAGAFTVVFLATGAYALLRYGRISARPVAVDGAGGEARVVELLHLLMSIAMVAMVWGWAGDPVSAGGVVQLMVFGGLAVLFAGLAVGARAQPAGRALSRGSHAVMALAMVWMVATMPLVAGHAAGSGDAGAGHAGHGAAASGMDMDMDMAMAMPASAPPGWVVGGTVVLAALLAAAGGRWVVRALRARSAAPGARPGALDASCHALMGLGMAAALLAPL